MYPTQSIQKLCTIVLLSCFCLYLSGCAGEQLPDGMPKPYPTTITIIQDDKPLEGATIALIPMDASNSWNAGGITNTSGNAALKTLTRYDGVVPGKYYVIIKKLLVDENKNTPNKETDPAGYAKWLEESARDTFAGYDLIDPKFSKISPDAETIEVVEGKNEKSTDIGKAVKIERRLPPAQ